MVDNITDFLSMRESKEAAESQRNKEEIVVFTAMVIKLVEQIIS